MSGQLKSKPACPECGQRLDGYTDISGSGQPEPGDVSICAYCSTVLTFTGSMKLAYAPPDVAEEVEASMMKRANHIAKRFQDNRAAWKKKKARQQESQDAWIVRSITHER